MEFRNEFTVPVGVDRAFAILTDLERVAPCLPGATLEEVDGDAYTGKVKVKVGPIQVAYKGTAELVEKDGDAHHAVIRARGREARGAGTASADVTADLVSEGAASTSVTVVTDLTITGKPAQFGRGVMEDVGTKLIGTFADRLAAMIEADEDIAESFPAPAADATPTPLPPPPGASTEPLPPAAEAPTADAGATGPSAPVTPITPDVGAPGPRGDGPRRIPPPDVEPEALDLMDVAGGALRKRLVPAALVAVLALVGAILWRRR